MTTRSLARPFALLLAAFAAIPAASAQEHVHDRSTAVRMPIGDLDKIGILYVASDEYRTATDLDERDRRRAALLQHERIFDIVTIAPGMTVGDVGAGDGYFTFLLAGKVGSAGKVYAEDISTKALGITRERAERKGLANVETIVGTPDDPRLPARQLDAAFIMIAFHEFDQPAAFLQNLARSLKPGGKLVIIDPDYDTSHPVIRVRDRQYYVSTFEKSPFTVDRLDTTTLPVDGTCRMAVWVLSLKGRK